MPPASAAIRSPSSIRTREDTPLVVDRIEAIQSGVDRLNGRGCEDGAAKLSQPVIGPKDLVVDDEEKSLPEVRRHHLDVLRVFGERISRRSRRTGGLDLEARAIAHDPATLVDVLRNPGDPIDVFEGEKALFTLAREERRREPRRRRR